MHDVKRQRDFLLIGEREPFQSAGLDVFGDHMARHVAPTEAGEQEIEAGRQVRKPPDMTTEDPPDRFWVSGVRSVSTSCTCGSSASRESGWGRAARG